MKRIIISSLLLVFAMSTAFAQDNKDQKKADEGFVFTTVKELKITPVKNQNSTGTCWCFSGMGFLESELLRTGKGEFDLSEMYIVSKNYKDKAEKYVRMHGKTNFGQGGSFFDVIKAWKDYGIVPASVMSGLLNGDKTYNHSEMEALCTSYLNTVIQNKGGKLSPSWKKGYDGIIDAYLGTAPETFTYNGKQYTPKSFAQELGLNMDDYVSLTSYTHHPFYTTFPLEIEDNWRWSSTYNVPLNEFMEVFDYAINNGYTIAWGSDVSETGFTRNGVAIIPDMDAIKKMQQPGTDEAKWTGTNPRMLMRPEFNKPVPEITPTQEMRQEAFDNYQTTDDHGMQIFGIAKDQTGKKYYMVKNSWGTESKYKGIWYASENFVAYKTMNIVVNKNAIPKEIRKKLGL